MSPVLNRKKMARKKVEIRLLKAHLGMKKGHEVAVDVSTAMTMIDNDLAEFVNEEDAENIAVKAKSVKKMSEAAKKADKKKKSSVSDAAKEQRKKDEEARKKHIDGINALKSGSAAVAGNQAPKEAAKKAEEDEETETE